MLHYVRKTLCTILDIPETKMLHYVRKTLCKILDVPDTKMLHYVRKTLCKILDVPDTKMLHLCNSAQGFWALSPFFLLPLPETYVFRQNYILILFSTVNQE